MGAKLSRPWGANASEKLTASRRIVHKDALGSKASRMQPFLHGDAIVPARKGDAPVTLGDRLLAFLALGARRWREGDLDVLDGHGHRRRATSARASRRPECPATFGAFPYSQHVARVYDSVAGRLECAGRAGGRAEPTARAITRVTEGLGSRFSDESTHEFSPKATIHLGDFIRALKGDA